MSNHSALRYNTQPLAEALAGFRATRSTYQSTSEQALTELLVSLTEEVMALRGQPPAAAVSYQEAPDAAELQAQIEALQVAYESQQAELMRLRSPAPSSTGRSLRSEVATPRREIHPMDYWEQHVPDYGDATPEADLIAYRSKLRVHPEDVVLSAEDRARLERRRPGQPTPQWVTIVVWIIALLLLLMVLNGIVDLRGLIEGLRPGA